MFRETASGARTDHTELRKALAKLDDGDVLMVTRLETESSIQTANPSARAPTVAIDPKRTYGLKCLMLGGLPSVMNVAAKSPCGVSASQTIETGPL